MSETDPTPGQKPGTVYTFYSYKGGVGRSMALANVGVLMALEKHKVLLVDFDLEAPGLDAFFSRNDACDLVGDPKTTPGILELLEARQNGEPLSWRKCVLRAQFQGVGIDLISAGMKSENYRKRIQ